MDVLEKTATEQPLCAKVLTLRTMSKETVLNETRHKALYGGEPLTKVSRMSRCWSKTSANISGKLVNQDWYARRGYEIFDYQENVWPVKDAKGKEWWSKAVLMRRHI